MTEEADENVVTFDGRKVSGHYTVVDPVDGQPGLVLMLLADGDVQWAAILPEGETDA